MHWRAVGGNVKRAKSSALESGFVLWQVLRAELAHDLVDVDHDALLDAFVLQHLARCCALASCMQSHDTSSTRNHIMFLSRL